MFIIQRHCLAAIIFATRIVLSCSCQQEDKHTRPPGGDWKSCRMVCVELNLNLFQTISKAPNNVCRKSENIHLKCTSFTFVHLSAHCWIRECSNNIPPSQQPDHIWRWYSHKVLLVPSFNSSSHNNTIRGQLTTASATLVLPLLTYTYLPCAPQIHLDHVCSRRRNSYIIFHNKLSVQSNVVDQQDLKPILWK